MSLTRRDAIKSILAATAVSATPSVVASAVLPLCSERTADTLKHIDYLLKLIAIRRGKPYNSSNDYITITLPCDCTQDEIAGIRSRFVKAHPHAEYYGEFDKFQHLQGLLVRVNPLVKTDVYGMDRVPDKDGAWAMMEDCGVNSLITSGTYPRDYNENAIPACDA